MAKEARSPKRAIRVFTLYVTGLRIIKRKWITIGWAMLDIKATMGY